MAAGLFLLFAIVFLVEEEKGRKEQKLLKFGWKEQEKE
jgi:hypothetical protein